MEENRQKILLIEPALNRLFNINASLNCLPLSLAYIAGIIGSIKPAWQVQIYNSDFSPNDFQLSLEYFTNQGFENYRHALNEPTSVIWSEIADVIRKFAPSVVGITVKSQNYASACMIAKIAKSIDKNIMVIFGGPHATLIKADLLKNPLIDIGVIGEGEETIVEILEMCEGDRSISSINGIVFRDQNKIIKTPKREFIQDLDALPFPITAARKYLLDFDKYPQEAFKYLISMRGCPFGCVFCGSRYLWSRKVRFRSVKNIITEIQEIQKAGIDYIHFQDDTWGVKKSFINELCKGIQENCPNLNWSIEIHVNIVNDESIALMKSAGCRLILMGVELGNNEMLKLIHKNITIEDAFSAARIIKKHKIFLDTFFMVGFPQETEESLNDTINAMTSIPSDLIIYSIFTPYLGTKLFDYCKEQGIVSNDFDVSLYNHQSPENYFCPNIPREIFNKRLRKLENELVRINARKNFRMYLSREGFLKFKQIGIRNGFQRLWNKSRQAIQK